MTISQLEQRLEAVEREVQKLRAQRRPAPKKNKWWRESAGRFEKDPLFDQIVQLGRKYRKSTRKPGG